MLQKRLQEVDCNADALFNFLTSESWPVENFAIRSINEACVQSNV